MSETSQFDLFADSLRQAFDRSFAEPPPQAAPEFHDLLTLSLGGDPYAIRLRDIVGLVADRKIVPVPARASDLLGLTGIAGAVVPVFGLASMLGYTGQAADSPRWLVLCPGDEAIALAFNDFDGHVRVPASAFQTAESAERQSASRPYLRHVAHTGTGWRPLIDLPLIGETIRSRTNHKPLTKEP